MQRRTLLTSAVGAAVAATFSTTAGAVQNRVTGSLPNVIDKNIRIYGNDAYPVPHRRAMEIGAVRARMPHDFVPGRRFLLKKGEIRTPGGAPLESDVVLEENMALKMRDGTTIYTDVFRPNDDGRHLFALALQIAVRRVKIVEACVQKCVYHSVRFRDIDLAVLHRKAHKAKTEVLFDPFHVRFSFRIIFFILDHRGPAVTSFFDPFPLIKG